MVGNSTSNRGETPVAMPSGRDPDTPGDAMSNPEADDPRPDRVPESRAGSTSVRGYAVNLALLMATVLLLSAWFYLHLYPYFVGVSIAFLGGVTLVFLAGQLAKAARSWWTFLLGVLDQETRQRLSAQFQRICQRYLGDPRKGRYYAMAVGAVLVLHLITTSVYVKCPAETDQSYEVRVRRPGDVEGRSFLVSSRDNVQGEVRLFAFPRGDVEFKLVKPGGYQIRRTRLPLAGSIHLQVPGEFEELHVVRLLPDSGLLRHLPEPRGVVRQGIHLLRVKRNGEPIEGEPIVLRRCAVYLGGSAEDLRWRRGREDEADRRRDLLAELRMNGVDESAHEYFLRVWEEDPQYASTPEWSPKDRLEVEVFVPAGEDGETAVKCRASLEIDSDPTTIQTISLSQEAAP